MTGKIFKTSACLRIAFTIALSAFLLLPSSALLAWQGRSYAELSGGYKTGDFGTTVTSNLYYLEADFGYIASSYDFGISVPYLYLVNTAEGASQNENNIGDVILRGGLVFVPEKESGFSLTGSLSTKLPTADETKGFGTGETDYGGFLGANMRLGDVILSLFGGYIFIGDTNAIDFNNSYTYGLGVSKEFESANIYASLEGSRSVVPGSDNPLEVKLGFFKALSIDYSLRGNVFLGLNNGGPGFGLNTGIARWF